jgi:hypothetical protein
MSPRGSASAPVRVIDRSSGGPRDDVKEDLSWDDTMPQPMSPAPSLDDLARAITAQAPAASSIEPPRAAAPGARRFRLSSRGLATAVGIASVLALALALALLIVTFRR